MLLHRFFDRVAGGGEPRSQRAEACIVQFSLQHFQSFPMTRLIGIDVRSPVQALGRLGEFACAGIDIKQLQQCLAVIAFPVGGVIQFAQEFQNLRR